LTPKWNELITLKRKNESVMNLKVFENDGGKQNDMVGAAAI
jgi:hypothetical protein